MANTFPNVRFYKLEVLPSFDAAKHTGIFVHVTSQLTRSGREDNYTYSWGKVSNDNIQKIVIQKIKIGEEFKTVLVPEWMNTRKVDVVESGLWFGGENGWELLSNDTSSGAIDTAIAALDVDGYSQAEITDDGTNSSLTIKGIKEEDGKIGVNAGTNFSVAIDGVYNSSTNKIATVGTVTSKINALDSEGTITTVTQTTSNGNTVLGFKGVKETDGIITQGENTDTFTVGDAKLKLVVGTEELEIFSANAQSDSELQLDSHAFQWNKSDDKFILGVKTKTAITDKNRLITESDIAGIAGAMHYKGTLTGAQSGTGSWPSTVAAGDVYIVTTAFTHGSDTLEVGDMVVFNSTTTSDYKVVQSNLTLGVAVGQVAANTDTLGDNKLVIGVNPSSGSKGIKTVDFDVTNLTGTTGKNERTLTLTSQRADAEVQGEGNPSVDGLTHGVGITDTFTIMGRNMNKSFSISSPNRSISIEKVGGANSTDAQVDLIWNTVMDA